MTKRTKRIVGITIAISLVALLFLAAAARVQVGRGGEGEVVRLQKVTYGKEHHFVGRTWQRILSSLPAALRRRVRAHPISYQTTNDAIVAWLVWKGESNKVYRSVPSYIIEDDTGNRVMLAGNAVSTHIDDETHIEGRELIVPRQGREFRLLLLYLDNQVRPKCTASFGISKTTESNYPVWQPEPLPACKTMAGAEITLVSFRAEREIRYERGLFAPLVELTAAVRENGEHSTNWQMTRIEATDAIGNRNSYRVGSRPNAQGEQQWSGMPLLWVDETWRLRLHFKRRAGTDTNAVGSVEFLVKPEIVSTNRPKPQAADQR